MINSVAVLQLKTQQAAGSPEMLVCFFLPNSLSQLKWAKTANGS